MKLIKTRFNINDSIRKSFWSDINFYLNQIKEKNDVQYIKDLISTFRDYKIRPEFIEEILEKNKDIILNCYKTYLNNLFNNELIIDTTINKILNCLLSIKKIQTLVDWPELIKIVDNSKNNIMKGILQSLKDVYDIKFIQTVMTQLIEIGIKWPQLNIIDKSIKAEIKPQRLNLDEASEYRQFLLNESNPDKSIQVVAIAKNLISNGHTLKALDYILGTGLKLKKSPALQIFLEENKKIFIRHALELFKSTDYNNTAFFIGKLSRLGLKWPEISAIEKSTRFELSRENLHESSEWKDTDGTYLRTIENYFKQDLTKQVLLFIALYNLTDNNVPGLKKLIEEYKPLLMKCILTTFKRDIIDGVNFVQTLQKINTLKNVGIDWPEFDTILKSITHQKKKINESAVRKSSKLYKLLQYDIHLSNMNEQLKSGQIVRACFDLKQHDDPSNIENIKTLFEFYRKRIIKYFLTHIKNFSDDTSTMQYIRESIRILLSKGFNWPELTIIAKSLSHLTNKGINESRNIAMLDKFGNYIADENLWNATKYMQMKV